MVSDATKAETPVVIGGYQTELTNCHSSVRISYLSDLNSISLVLFIVLFFVICENDVGLIFFYYRKINKLFAVNALVKHA